MDQDAPIEGAAPQTNREGAGDDLAKYTLEDYDEEDTMPGQSFRPTLLSLPVTSRLSSWALQQYQGSYILP